MCSWICNKKTWSDCLVSFFEHTAVVSQHPSLMACLSTYWCFVKKQQRLEISFCFNSTWLLSKMMMMILASRFFIFLAASSLFFTLLSFTLRIKKNYKRGKEMRVGNHESRSCVFNPRVSCFRCRRPGLHVQVILLFGQYYWLIIISDFLQISLSDASVSDVSLSDASL